MLSNVKDIYGLCATITPRFLMFSVCARMKGINSRLKIKASNLLPEVVFLRVKTLKQTKLYF